VIGLIENGKEIENETGLRMNIKENRKHKKM
jgi:hypothetical protein